MDQFLAPNVLGLTFEIFEKGEHEAKSATCKLCNKLCVAYHGRTINPQEHLIRTHPNEFKPPKQQQPSLSSF